MAAKAGTIRIFNARTGRVESVERIAKSDDEWRKALTPRQFEITRRAGTEEPFTGKCDCRSARGFTSAYAAARICSA
jgi:hypothetical protein